MLSIKGFNQDALWFVFNSILFLHRMLFGLFSFDLISVGPLSASCLSLCPREATLSTTGELDGGFTSVVKGWEISVFWKPWKRNRWSSWFLLYWQCQARWVQFLSDVATFKKKYGSSWHQVCINILSSKVRRVFLAVRWDIYTFPDTHPPLTMRNNTGKCWFSCCCNIQPSQ